MIPAPVILVAIPLVAAGIVLIIRRLTLVASLLSAAAAAGLAWLVTVIPQQAGETTLGGWVSGGKQIILGRTLAVSPADREMLLALSIAATVFFLLALRLRPDGIFYPGLLALLGLAAAVLVNETFVLSVLLVEMCAGVVTVLLQGARFGSIRGSWRFFLFATLALPFLLIAGWHIDVQVANPGQTNLLDPAVLLLTLGFVIYLAAVPFHLWLSPVTQECHPLALIAALGFFPLIVLSVIAGAFEAYSWFADSQVPYQWFNFVGSATVGLGAILALGASRSRQLAGHSLMVETGALLLLVGARSQAGLEVALAILLLRMAGLAVWGSGLVLSPRTHLQRYLAQAAVLLGGMSLVGLPFTPGFPGRWMALGVIARSPDGLGRATLLLLGSVTGAVGVWRITTRLLASRAEPLPEGSPDRWSWLSTLALILVLLGGIALALYPQPVISAAGRIAVQFGYAP